MPRYPDNQCGLVGGNHTNPGGFHRPVRRPAADLEYASYLHVEEADVLGVAGDEAAAGLNVLEVGDGTGVTYIEGAVRGAAEAVASL